MIDCPKASEHTQYAHVDLGEDAWAHFIKKPTYDQSERIQAAELAADYRTAGIAKAATAMIQAHLSAAPEEWRNGHADPDGTVHEGQFEPTMNVVRLWFDQYETKVETVLLGPETRQKMAKATLDFYRTCAQVWCHEGSWGEWPPTDGTLGEIIERKALDSWYAWRAEVNKRLKAAGIDSD